MNEKKDKSKILYVITKSNWGGAQKYVHDLATSFRKSYSSSSDVIVAHGGNGEMVEELQKVGIATYFLPSAQRAVNPLKEITLASELFGLYMKQKPKVIHLNSTKIGGLGAFIARLWQIITILLAPLSLLPTAASPPPTPKIIFTAHGWVFNEDRSWVFKVFAKVAHWLTIIFSSKVICVSDNIKEQVNNWPLLSRQKLRVIHNGIKPPSFKNKADAISELVEKAEEDSILIGTIGELRSLKGHTCAISAIAELVPDYSVQLVIIGEGRNKSQLENQIRKHNLGDFITLAGHRDNAAAYLTAFDIYIHPSYSEALGYAIIEAGFAKLPVIASNVGGIPEIIEDEKTGLLIPPRDSTELASAIKQLIDHPAQGKKMAENLYNRVNENFTKDAMVKKTRKIYSLE